MTRALLGLALATALSGCGLMLDGVYLISDKRFTKEERQSLPTEHSQPAFEHTVRAERGQVWLACEDTVRPVERVWTVRKQYEHDGGIYQGHLATLLLDVVVGGALGVGFGVSCAEGGTGDRCLPLLSVTPFAIDALYSAVRLAMVGPPKLVHKERLGARSEPGPTPTWRQTVACEPDAVIMVGRSAADPLAAWFRVDAWGAMTVEDERRLVEALLREGNQLFWAAGGKAPTAAGLGRCEALKGLGRACPEATTR